MAKKKQRDSSNKDFSKGDSSPGKSSEGDPSREKNTSQESDPSIRKHSKKSKSGKGDTPERAGRRSRKSRSGQLSGPIIADYWEQIPSSYRYLLVLAFLFLIPSFIFSEVYFGGQRFVAHDIQQFRATAQSVIEYQEDTGEDALWASHIFSGMPSYTVIGNKAFFHLDSLIRRTFSAMFIPVFPFIFCMGGVVFFFWLMGYRPLPSALAAIAICLTAYIPIIVGAGHNSKLIAYSWIPWVMAGYWMLSRSDKRLAGVFLFALALNFALRAEHVQVVYYFLFPLGIWFIYDSVEAFRGKTISGWTRRASLMILAGLLALAANIQPYWSIYEYSPYSIRSGSELQANAGSGGLDVDYAFAWSQGRAELLTLLVPNSFGGSSADGTYWGPKSFTSGPHYLGAIIFLMFLIGLIRGPGRLKFIFLGSGLLAMLFSLGQHFYSFNILFFNYMPFFSKFRTPEMWLIVTVFCFAVIAAMGMKWIHDSFSDGSLTLRSLYLPVGIALATALFFGLLTGSILSFEKEGERMQLAQQVASQQNMRPDDPQVRQFVNRYIDQQIMPERAEMAASDGRRFLIFILLGGILLASAATRKIPANYVLAGLVLLAAVDMLQVGGRYVDKSGLIPSGYSSYDAVAEKVRPLDRFIEERKMQDQIWPWRTFPLGDNPFNNAVPSAFVYPSIGGYSGAKLSNYQDVIDHAIFSGSSGLNLQVLNMLNTRFLTFSGPLNLPGWSVAFESDRGAVMENENALPKAWFVDELIVAESPGQAVEELSRFEAAASAILFEASSSSFLFDAANAGDRNGATASADRNGATASGGRQDSSPRVPEIIPTDNRTVAVTRYGPREIRLDVRTDAPSFLVLSEIYYPKGWRAMLNGEETKIYRTNYILRGFSIPAGSHELTLRFDPRSHIIGGWLSILFNLAILLLGGVALVRYIREKR